MFGTIAANPDKLTPEESLRYRSCYCGLCRALGDRHGTMSRVTINYDMTFLVLLLSALYGEGCTVGKERCLIRPWKTHPYFRSGMSDYAADMNIVLAYYHFLDDWADEKKVLSLLEAKLFEKEVLRIAARYPHQCSTIRRCMADLSAIERAGETNPDVPANCFGQLMGAVFAVREDGHAGDLRAFGGALGKFVYVMDACLDLKRDIRKELYNPMITTASGGFDEILNLLMADCVAKYRRLPVRQDGKLLENILYSGIWTKYEADRKKAGRRGGP